MDPLWNQRELRRCGGSPLDTQVGRCGVRADGGRAGARITRVRAGDSTRSQSSGCGGIRSRVPRMAFSRARRRGQNQCADESEDLQGSPRSRRLYQARRLPALAVTNSRRPMFPVSAPAPINRAPRIPNRIPAAIRAPPCEETKLQFSQCPPHWSWCLHRSWKSLCSRSARSFTA